MSEPDPRLDALKLFADCEHKWVFDPEMNAIAETVAANLSLITGQPRDAYRMPAVMALELKRHLDAQRIIEVCGVCGEPYTEGRCQPDPNHAGYSYCTRGPR